MARATSDSKKVNGVKNPPGAKPSLKTFLFTKIRNQCGLKKIEPFPFVCYNSSSMKKTVWLLLLAAGLWAQTAEDVARKTEAKLRSYRTLRADFEHLYFSSSLATPLKEQGQCYFQKPNLMKWHYEEPEEKIYLLKGKTIESYFPEDNQLLRSSFTEEEESEILALLSGKQGLLEKYTAEFNPFPTDNTGVQQLKLTPRDDGSGNYILLEIDEQTWLIRKAVFFDWAGNKSEFHFSRLRLNVSLPRKTFELKVPPGTEIIEDIK
jgi:outer membrane lipoprotein-sorting protein